MEKKARQIARLLKALANENRLLVLCALMRQPMTVGEIAGYVPSITLSALSQHLNLLKAHGILDSQKAGQRITYVIADRRVEKLMHALREHCCEEENAE